MGCGGRGGGLDAGEGGDSKTTQGTSTTHARGRIHAPQGTRTDRRGRDRACSERSCRMKLAFALLGRLTNKVSLSVRCRCGQSGAEKTEQDRRKQRRARRGESGRPELYYATSMSLYYHLQVPSEPTDSANFLHAKHTALVDGGLATRKGERKGCTFNDAGACEKVVVKGRKRRHPATSSFTRAAAPQTQGNKQPRLPHHVDYHERWRMSACSHRASGAPLSDI